MSQLIVVSGPAGRNFGPALHRLAFAAGDLTRHGAWFDIKTAELDWVG